MKKLSVGSVQFCMRILQFDGVKRMLGILLFSDRLSRKRCNLAASSLNSKTSLIYSKLSCRSLSSTSTPWQQTHCDALWCSGINHYWWWWVNNLQTYWGVPCTTKSLNVLEGHADAYICWNRSPCLVRLLLTPKVPFSSSSVVFSRPTWAIMSPIIITRSVFLAERIKIDSSVCRWIWSTYRGFYCVYVCRFAFTRSYCTKATT